MSSGDPRADDPRRGERLAEADQARAGSDARAPDDERARAWFSGRAAIAVLGPARLEGPRANRVAEVANALGNHAGRQGYGLVVHGQGLVAQAAARGARQVDAPVVAVAARAPSSVSGAAMGRLDVPNVLIEERQTSIQALERALELSNALVLLHGDLHAVATLTQVWSWGLEPDAPFRQTILVGDGWPETVRTLADAVGLDQRTRATVTFAREAPEAIEALRYYVAPR